MAFKVGNRGLNILCIYITLYILSAGALGQYGDTQERLGSDTETRSWEGKTRGQQPLDFRDRLEGEKERGSDDYFWLDGQREGTDGPLNPLEELHYALQTLQTHYFEISVGIWPDAIDWTAAVMGTYVSAVLTSLTKSLEYVLPSSLQEEGSRVENEINKYFSQSIAYYFGENAFAIRTQAYDDMLWVVLGWLESIKFTRIHTRIHYPASDGSLRYEAWYGKQFIPTFAHRARIFYDLATKGWDTTLCGGGMLWNPHLRPYKNAITNQLFISASIDMYLYFPGDHNSSPWLSSNAEDYLDSPPAPAHDLEYLESAVNAYSWLKSSNMTNDLGLYVDGYHIRDYGHNGTIGTGKCDERNEMVYTYNQGVLLSGLRGLWESTGLTHYLSDGHELVRNVISATGWSISDSAPRNSWRWAGLGRNGVLEEYCDHTGLCSQDGQTFKGIFFHHMTLFCGPLPTEPMIPGRTFAANSEVRRLHAQSCKEYAPWVARNARAALATRDLNGDFGMWWGQPAAGTAESVELPEGAVDWRNNDTLLEEMGIVRPKKWRKPRQGGDANDRGRGRTVETQGGGVSVVRALWEFVNMYRHE